PLDTVPTIRRSRQRSSFSPILSQVILAESQLLPRSSRPRHGKQLLQRDGLAWRENNSRGGVLDVHLPHQLATSATRSASHTFVGHRHDAINLGFARLEHLCDRRVLGTKPEAARRVNADAAVEGAAPGYQRCRNSASRAVLAGSK